MSSFEIFSQARRGDSRQKKKTLSVKAGSSQTDAPLNSRPCRQQQKTFHVSSIFKVFHHPSFFGVLILFVAKPHSLSCDLFPCIRRFVPVHAICRAGQSCCRLYRALSLSRRQHLANVTKHAQFLFFIQHVCFLILHFTTLYLVRDCHTPSSRFLSKLRHTSSH